jgi:hypothetical protein
MNRMSAASVLAAAAIVGSFASTAPRADTDAGPVTFNKQVLPILQKNC